MMSKGKLEKYADVLWWGLSTARGKKYRKGDVVLVRYDLPALKLAEVIQASLLDNGLNPVMRQTMTPAMEHNFYYKSNLKQLTFEVPGERELCKHLNGGIYLHAPASLTHLRDVDPRKIGKALVARKPLRDILQKREEKGEYGWTLCLFPTDELARQAGMDTKEYTKQVIRACYLDKKDPVSKWKEIYQEAKAIKKWLNSLRIKTLRIESKNMDLEISQGEKRRWVGISGHNIPSFELFISPDWRGAEGVYYADQPSYRSGNLVQGVRLTFKGGKVIKAEAGKGQEFLRKQLAMDPGARRVGEFSLTDKRFSRINKFMANTLYDENYGGKNGNCHLALGASYSDTYDGDPRRLTKKRKGSLGFNDSALHWDLVNTEDKRVTAILADGREKVVYENGIFKY